MAQLYLDDSDPVKRQLSDGHSYSFVSFYLEYPSEHKPAPMRLVGTITKEPPELSIGYMSTRTH
jgi:hypothetical protein